MFHIFNKLYVESDALINQVVRQVNISRHTGFAKLVDPSQPQNPQGQVAYGSCLEDFDQDTFKELLSSLAASQESTIIYADSESYTRLFSVVIKALFPEIGYEHFKRLFLCRKVSFDSYAVNQSSYLNSYATSVEITLERVKELYEMNDPYAAAYREFLSTHDVGLSLEWRVFKFIATGEVGNIPDTLSSILRKTAIRTGQEALLEWGRLITDDAWLQHAGVTVDALLSAPTAARACSNFDTLNSKLLSESNAVKMRVSDVWLEDLCGEAASVLESSGETDMAGRTRRLALAIRKIPDLQNPAALRELLEELFSNERNSIRTSVEDSNKIDENIIRYALKQGVDTVSEITRNSQW